MRRLVACMLLAVGMLAGMQNAWGQAPTGGAGVLLRRDVAAAIPQLRRKISLRLEGASMEEAFRTIALKADLPLTYNDRILPRDRKVWLTAIEIRTDEALEQVLRDSGLQLLALSTGQVVVVRIPVGPAERVQAGSVAGRVTDARTGAALPATEVFLEGTRYRGLTDADGQYRLTRVDTGKYSITARRIGYTKGTQSLIVAADQEATVNFALEVAATQLDELVTVTPGGMQTEVKALPTPVSVITSDAIAQRRPQTIQDVFRQAIPTAVAFDNPFQPVGTRLSVRGASSLSGVSLMKTFVDGVESSSFILSPVDPASIERIEIVRGPQAATLYGADAVGGVVQIFTKRGIPGLERPRVNVQAEAGLVQTPYEGFGGVLRQHYAGSVTGGGVDVSYNLGGGYTRLADWLPDGEISAQSSPSVYGGVRYARGLVTADLHARYYRNDLPLVVNPLVLTAGFVPLARPQFQPNTFTNETYGARVTVSPASWWQNTLTMGVDRFNQEQVQARRRLTTPADTLSIVGSGGGRKVSFGINSSLTTKLAVDIPASLTVGFDHFDQDALSSFTARALNTEGTIETSPPGAFTESRNAITNTGYFAQAQVSWRDAVFLTGGLRAEENSTFGRDLSTPVLPRVGLSMVQRVGAAEVKVRGAYGRAIRAPSPGQGTGGVGAFQITLANPLLGPERQSGWDAGIDIAFRDRASLSVTGYDQTGDNLIVFLQVANDPLPTFQNQNIGRVLNRGVELEGTLSLHPLTLKAQYGYVRSRIEDVGPSAPVGAQLQVGDRPLGIPTHTAGASVTVTPQEGTTLSGGLTYVGSFRQVDLLGQLRCLGGSSSCPPTPRDGVITYPGFAKLNLAFTQRVTRHIDATLSVDNLTNSHVYEGINILPVMGRMTMLGLHFSH